MNVFLGQSMIFFLSCVSTSIHSTVIELNDKSFTELVLNTDDKWFVDFYAPWCGHCKKLEPILAEVSSDIGAINVGKMDATRYKAIALSENITHFPTIKYYKSKIRRLYDGPRTVEGILTFMAKVQAPVFHQISTLNELDDRIFDIYPVSFVLYLGQNENSQNILPNFIKIAELMSYDTYFATVDSIQKNQETSSFITKIERDQTPKLLDISYLATGNMSLVEAHTYFENHKYPLISKLENHNFHILHSIGKMMFIVVIDPSDLNRKTELLNVLSITANSLSDFLLNSVIIGYLDGKKWDKFIAKHNVTVLPSILILDPIEDSYYAIGQQEVFNSVDSLSSLLTATANYKLTAFNKEQTESQSHNILKNKLMKFKHPNFLTKIWQKLVDAYPWSLLCVVPILLVALMIYLSGPEDDDEKND